MRLLFFLAFALSLVIGCSTPTAGTGLYLEDAVYEIRAYQLSDCAQNGVVWVFKNPMERDETSIGVHVLVARIPNDGSTVIDRLYCFDPVRGIWTADEFSSDRSQNWILPHKNRYELAKDLRLWPTTNEVASVVMEGTFQRITMVHGFVGAGHPSPSFPQEEYFGQVTRAYLRSDDGRWHGTQTRHGDVTGCYPEYNISGRRIIGRWASMLEDTYKSAR